MTRSSFRPLALLVLAALLSACATFGIPDPRDFNDRASLAYDVAEEGVATTRALLAADQLSADDAESAIDQLEGYQRAIAIARNLYAINAADGEARLAAIRGGLADLIEYLEGRADP